MSHMMLETDNRQDIQTPSVVSMPKLNVGAPPPPHHYRPNPTGESDHITFNSNGKERETSHSYTITCSVKMIKGPIITPPSGGKKKKVFTCLNENDTAFIRDWLGKLHLETDYL